jgi:type 1 glutamine amidotransferase
MNWRLAASCCVGPAAVLAAVISAGSVSRATAQQSTAPPAAQPQPGSPGGGVPASIFTLLDANKDGSLGRDEVKTGFDAWYTQWDRGKTGALTLEQVFMGLNAAVPAAGDVAQAQNQTPRAEDVAAMMAALPGQAPAKPRQPRRVLVLGRAAGFVHSSIPLAARTIEEMGKKTGAWSTTITYDAADINAANLKQFDAIFLASTTGAFLDDPKDAAATAARREALLAFVRGGKGLAGIHAAADSYHQSSAPSPGGAGAGAINWGLVSFVLHLMAGDANSDGRLSREEVSAFAGTWYDTLDPDKSGRLVQADFVRRYAALPPPPMPEGAGGANSQAKATELGPDTEVGTWPEFNRMIGAFFKFHWNDGQTITVKIDDPAHPVNAPFNSKGYVIVDETYTFSRETYSRQNLHVLTSIDYAKMSAGDKAKEQNPRTDGDYALSWVRREGKGRVFYEAHGHNEKIYANKPLLAHVLAGMQYVLGDLPADDTPSQPGARR